MRQSVQNNCDIYLVFNGDWQVVYDVGNEAFSNLEINIDPYTGKIIKSH